MLALVGTAFLLVRAAGLEDWIKFSAFLVYGLSMIGPLHRLYSVPLRQHHSRGRLALAEI